MRPVPELSGQEDMDDRQHKENGGHQIEGFHLHPVLQHLPQGHIRFSAT